MILDPTQITKDTAAPSFGTEVPFVSKALLDFGFVPDSRLLKPGDLLFLERLKPNCAANLIRKTQEKFSPRGANWTHVAIYISDWQIIHCRPWKGVHVDTLLNFVLGHRILAKRLTAITQAGATQAESMGLNICLHAALNIKGSKYDYVAAIRTWYQMLKMRATFIPGDSEAAYVFMCSSLYARSVLDAEGISLRSRKLSQRNLTVTPQALFISDLMGDVPLSWAKLS